MKRHSIALSVLLFACSGGAAETPPPVVNKPANPLLRHHEIRPDQLPAPYATPSAGNPPRVVDRPPDAALNVPPGFRIGIYAEDFEDPRNMILAPNGDVFVAETGANRISLLRDENGDGKVDRRSTYATGLNEPFGLAINGGWLYVGETNGIQRIPYKSGELEAKGTPMRIASLPPGGHSTRNIIFNRDGTKMYVAVGSASNVSSGEESMRAAISEFNADGKQQRIFASGLRNPVGLAWEPVTNMLWTAVNERDGLGDDLVPDYITEVRPGAFYGWPYSYIGQNEDPRRREERRDLVAKAVVPSVLIESHAAALGLVFYNGKMFPAEYNGDAFVALHGSWNRASRSGYKIIRVPFSNGKPQGGYDDFVVGWAPDPKSKRVWGRPVGLVVLRDGSLLIADDGSGVIWRVTYAK